jgi:hypothetical protein
VTRRSWAGAREEGGGAWEALLRGREGGSSWVGEGKGSVETSRARVFCSSGAEGIVGCSRTCEGVGKCAVSSGGEGGECVRASMGEGGAGSLPLFGAVLGRDVAGWGLL